MLDMALGTTCAMLACAKGSEMKRRIVWIVFNLLTPVLAHAASFDCEKASTKIEKLICENAELSRLDEEMNAAYKAALKDSKHAGAIKQLQKEWVKERNACSDAACVKADYTFQIAALDLPIPTTPAGQLVTAREDYTATLLPNGKVLIAGGRLGEESAVDSAELYDPAMNRFTATGNLSYRCFNHASILLQNGKVLLAGGEFFNSADAAGLGGPCPTELYDSATGTFSEIDNIVSLTFGQFSGGGPIVLGSGKVLLPTGSALTDYGLGIYDPSSGRVTSTGPLIKPRDQFATVLLKNGDVLIFGGRGRERTYIATAELYSPASNRFIATGDLVTFAAGPTVLLPNGNVLILRAGGRRAVLGASGDFKGIQLYDPAKGAFSLAGSASMYHPMFATLLGNGKVLIAGMDVGGLFCLELYDPATKNSVSVGRLPFRSLETSTLLKDGRVLFLGDGGVAELYAPN